MTQIKNEVSMQLYGDADLINRIIFALSEGLDLECNETHSKPYTTKRGREGTYKKVQCSLR